MTNYDDARSVLIAHINQYLTVECVTDERTGAWTTATGYLTKMSGASSNTGHFIVKMITIGEDKSDTLPIKGLISIRRNGQLVWEKKSEEPTTEKCGCSEEHYKIFVGWPFS